MGQGDYLRVSVTFTVTSGASTWVGLYFQRTQAGAAPDASGPPTAYFDDISLVPASGAGSASLLSGGAMEQGQGDTLANWSNQLADAAASAQAETDEDFFGDRLMAISGADGAIAWNTLEVYLPYEQWSRAPLLLSGFAYAQNSACNLPGAETRTQEEDGYGDLVEVVISS